MAKTWREDNLLRRYREQLSGIDVEQLENDPVDYVVRVLKYQIPEGFEDQVLEALTNFALIDSTFDPVKLGKNGLRVAKVLRNLTRSNDVIEDVIEDVLPEAREELEDDSLQEGIKGKLSVALIAGMILLSASNLAATPNKGSNINSHNEVSTSVSMNADNSHYQDNTWRSEETKIKKNLNEDQIKTYNSLKSEFIKDNLEKKSLWFKE